MDKQNDIKLVGLDLDGTLTQHKSKLIETNRIVLEIICKKYKAVIVGAGTCNRIFDQLDKFPIDIIGNYGMQESTTLTENGVSKLKLVRDIKIELDKESIIKKINYIRTVTEYKKIKGETVEFHPSGAITFPLLGTEADKRDKLLFDPDRHKRRKIYDLVKDEFRNFTVFIGGTSSFDIVPKEYNKYNALLNYARQFNINVESIIYFGDDYGLGGNDEHIYKSNIKFIKIDNYLDFEKYAKIVI